MRYSVGLGRFPRVTHPSAAPLHQASLFKIKKTSFFKDKLLQALKPEKIVSPSSLLEGGALDLHVLSLPPAFVLSQDQTLMLRIRFWHYLVTLELTRTSHDRKTVIPERTTKQSVYSHFKNVTAKVSFQTTRHQCLIIRAPTRRPRFSFFSSSIVKKQTSHPGQNIPTKNSPVSFPSQTNPQRSSPSGPDPVNYPSIKRRFL